MIFPDNLLATSSTPVHVQGYSYHASVLLVLKTRLHIESCWIPTRNTNAHLTKSSFRTIFHDEILFHQHFHYISQWQVSKFLTFPDQRSVVTLYKTGIWKNLATDNSTQAEHCNRRHDEEHSNWPEQAPQHAFLLHSEVKHSSVQRVLTRLECSFGQLKSQHISNGMTYPDLLQCH